MAPKILSELLDFDVDRYLNPFIPHNRLYILPKPVSHFLGYRKEPPKEPCAALQWPITILATITGLCLVGGIGNYAPGIKEWHPPVVIASLGASAVLDFNTLRSPLAQPRNSIIGNTLAALCGVCIAKLFQLNSDFNNIQWVSGAVGCALASWAMSLTNTIHPPGGATALLASTQSTIVAMGWRLIPIVLLDSTLMVCVALIFNNILRQYPTHWWTSDNVGSKLRQERRDAKAEEEGKAAEYTREQQRSQQQIAAKAVSDTSSDRTLTRELSKGVDSVGSLEDVYIEPYRLQLPLHIVLSKEEMALWESIQERLSQHGETR